MTSSGMSLRLFIDGASRGNPGPAAIGVHMEDGQGRCLAQISECIGNTTNNQAEYRALLAGLRKAAEMGADTVEVMSDSELLVLQLEGRYRVRNAGLRPLYAEAVRLLGGFKSASVSHVRREWNREADRLANEALNRRKNQT